MVPLKILIPLIFLLQTSTKAQNVSSNKQPTSYQKRTLDNSFKSCKQIINPELLGRTNTLRNQTWPNGRVPYALDKTVTGKYKQAFFTAINNYHEKTCVRFVQKTQHDNNFILVRIGTNGDKYCGLATVCNWNRPNQHFEMSDVCALNSGTWAHELGHIICLIHEQERKDRNEYLTFEGCPAESIPKITPEQDDLGTLYDYNSALHYPCYNNCWGRPSKHGATKCGREVPKNGLSILDIDKVNLIYNCGWCHRRRWYSVYRLDKEKMATLVDFRSSDMPGDKGRGAIYACRGYVGDEGEIGVGTCEPAGKHGWRCIIAWKGRMMVVEPNFELLALPYYSNKLVIKNGGVQDKEYRLVSNSDESVKNLYIPGGRTDLDKPIYIGVVHENTEGGQMGTFVGKVYGQEAAAGGYPQNKALVVVRGNYFEASNYYVVACS